MDGGQGPGSERRRSVVVFGLGVVFVAVLAGVRLTSAGEPQATSPSGQVQVEQAESPPRSVVRSVEAEPQRLTNGELAGLRFVEVTDRVGLSGGVGAAEPRVDEMDAGVAVADVDADGDHDLLLTSAGAASGLYRNDRGRFADITDASGITLLSGSTAVAFADVDGDDDLDLFAGGPDDDFGRLLINDGSGRYVDQSQRRGVVGRQGSGAGRSIRGVDFGDIDRDGDLDLIVADWNSIAIPAAEAAAGDASDRYTSQCHFAATTRRAHLGGSVEVTGDTRLFQNDGSGVFSDVTRSWGIRDLGISLAFTPQFADLDGDGWLDLAVTGDTCTSALFHNEGGRRFRDVTRAALVGKDENGMGSLIRDLDGDGRLDWLVTSIAYPTSDGSCPYVSLFAGCSGNRVYLNKGGMIFDEATDELGLRNSGWGWGVVAEDFANDGRLQIAVTNGRVGSPTPDSQDQAEVYYDSFRRDSTRFWVQASPGATYTDVAEQVGIRDDGVSHALVSFDYDSDGRLDVLVANAGAAPHLYRNVSRGDRHWLGIRLRDPTSRGNNAGLGARVEITKAGTTTTRWMLTSGSYQSQHPAEVHVGLGSSSRQIRKIRIWWLGQSHPQVVKGIQPDQVITVTRGRGAATLPP